MRLADADEAMRELLGRTELPELSSTPVAPQRPADGPRCDRHNGGAARGGDRVFERPGEYRLIPDGVDPADLVMSHGSVNFDRSGLLRDTELVFPLRRLHELAESGEIASVGSWHYAFMGAVDPSSMVETGREVGRGIARSW